MLFMHKNTKFEKTYEEKKRLNLLQKVGKYYDI